jgi:hypothetical protein
MLILGVAPILISLAVAGHHGGAIIGAVHGFSGDPIPGPV